MFSIFLLLLAAGVKILLVLSVAILLHHLHRARINSRRVARRADGDDCRHADAIPFFRAHRDRIYNLGVSVIRSYQFGNVFAQHNVPIVHYYAVSP
jgi:hypothetical protein